MTMIPAMIFVVMCLALTLVGLLKCVHYMDNSENPFVQKTCFLEGMFFLSMFLTQLAAYTGLFVYLLPLL